PEKKVIRAGRFKIGLIHGGGKLPDLEERVIAAFRDDGVDCIVFGHSHTPVVKRVGKIMLVNPGSPTDRRWAPYNSYAVIHVNDEINAEIIRLSPPAREAAL
ncbi:MAG TPA: metallophosphoesterase family protein, partial [Nitrospirota bacterium]|nr:metallophosphoesterase family protein [Nitrospirota bacterium]